MNDHLDSHVGKVFTLEDGTQWRLVKAKDARPFTYRKKPEECKHDGIMIYTCPMICEQCGKRMG